MSMYAIGEKSVQSVPTDQVIENWVVFVNGAGIKGTIFSTILHSRWGRASLHGSLKPKTHHST